MATKQAIAEVLVLLGAAYPRFSIPADTARVYASLLADLPNELLLSAAQQHAASSKWFPSVAELRAAALKLWADAHNVRGPEEAWVQVQRAIQRWGWYGEPVQGGGWQVPAMLSTTEKTAIKGLGGWRVICQSDNAPADRAHFLKIYSALMRREQEQYMMLPAVRQTMQALAGQPQLSEA